MEKAFDRILRKTMQWAMRKNGFALHTQRLLVWTPTASLSENLIPIYAFFSPLLLAGGANLLFSNLSQAHLPPLRVTPDSFALFSYEQALRHPTSFSTSGLARFIVKLRLFRWILVLWELFSRGTRLWFLSFRNFSLLFSHFFLEAVFLHCSPRFRYFLLTLSPFSYSPTYLSLWLKRDSRSHTSPTSHSDSFRSVISWASPSSSNHEFPISNFGQT